MSIKVLQANIGRCRLSQDLLRQTAFEKNIDVLLITEPYCVPEDPRFVCDPTRKAAIAASGGNAIQYIRSATVNGMVAADIESVTFVSCYVPPSKTPRRSEPQFEALMDSITTVVAGRHRVVITGDFNAHSPEWGCTKEDVRGEQLASLVRLLGLVVLNDGRTPTYKGGWRGKRVAATPSIVDVTFVSPCLVGRNRWRVTEGDYGDHRPIWFTIPAKQLPAPVTPQRARSTRQ